MIIEELDKNELEHDFEEIREELLKWCVMPSYMSRDRRGFNRVLRYVCNIAEWIWKSNHIYKIQEAGDYDYEGEDDFVGQYSITRYLPLWEWFEFKFSVDIMQMRADEIAIEFNEPRCDLTKYSEEITDFVNSVIKWDCRKNSLFDLQGELNKISERILEKSKI